MKKFNKFIEFLPLVGDLLDGKNIDMTRMRSVGTSTEDDPLMKNLCNAVTDMLGSTVKHLKNKLSRYVNVSGYALTRFIPDFTFYIRWADFCSKITETGMPMTRPEILALEKNSLSSKGIYDLKLAIQNLEGANIDIVSNDFEFATENGIYIMTGLFRRSHFKSRLVITYSRTSPPTKIRPSTWADSAKNQNVSVKSLLRQQTGACFYLTNLLQRPHLPKGCT